MLSFFINLIGWNNDLIKFPCREEKKRTQITYKSVITSGRVLYIKIMTKMTFTISNNLFILRNLLSQKSSFDDDFSKNVRVIITAKKNDS
jgi:hypothetical protein